MILSFQFHSKGLFGLPAKRDTIASIRPLYPMRPQTRPMRIPGSDTKHIKKTGNNNMKAKASAIDTRAGRLELLLAGTLLAAALCIVGASTVHSQTLPDQPAPLAVLVEEALSNNQELLSLEQKVESLRSLAPFSGSLPDPRLGLGLANVPTDTFELDQEAMTQKQIFFAQKVPWFGTLDLKEQNTVLEALRQERLLEAKRLSVKRKVSTLWYDLAFTNESLRANQELSVLVEQVLRVAETRYATGQGLQQDILAAQVSRTELIDERITLENTRRTLTDRINALLNRDGFTRIETPEGLPLPESIPAAKALKQVALSNNPLVAARVAALDKAQVAISLAEQDYYPDMDFKIAYGQREDNPLMNTERPDFVSGSVTLTLPLWQNTRQDSKLESAQKSHEAALKSLHALRTTLPHQVDAAVTQAESALENYRLFNDALTQQAAQWADSSQAAYETGKVEFGTMLNARMRLIRFKLKAHKYNYQAHKKLAELNELIGGTE